MNPCDFSRILASAPDLHNSRYPRKSGCHTTFHHRYHLAWAPKCRFKVLQARSACGYFPATSGTITDDIIMGYLDRYTHKDGFSLSI